MKAYALAAGALAALLLALFGIAQALDVPLLADESPQLGAAGPAAAAASFALLASDVLLPVPSSALMILNGALFGPFGGALLSIVVTRPVPVLAETAAILAGAAGMPLRRLAPAAAVGSLPPALAYALAGAYAERFDAGLAVFAGVLVLAAAVWLLDRRRSPPQVTAG